MSDKRFHPELDGKQTRQKGQLADYALGPDFAEVHSMLSLAVQKLLRMHVTRLLTPAQIAEAQRPAREWKPTK